MIDKIQKYGLEYLGRYYSRYRAVVINNNDPNNINRLLVNIPGVQGGIKVWARSGSFNGSIKSGFRYLTPLVGEIVWVEFEGGDPMKPIWHYHTWGVDEVPDELKDNDRIGIVTPSGNKIYLVEKDGTLHIEVKGDFTINSSKIIMQSGDVGIPETTSVVNKLNQLESQINDLKDLFLQSIGNVKPSDGGASALATFTSWASNKIEETVNEDIESDTIFQPN